jgi:hypothetical protein
VSDPTLLRFFYCTAEDVVANRAGRLGEEQKRRMRRGATMIAVVVPAVTIALMAAAAAVRDELDAGFLAVAAAVVVGGFAAGWWLARLHRRAADDGRVEIVVGAIETRFRNKAFWLKVGGQEFQLRAHLPGIAPGLPYRVYFAPRSRAVVWVERVEL